MRPHPVFPSVKHGHLEHTRHGRYYHCTDFENNKEEAVLLDNPSFIHQISVELFTVFQKLGTRP